MRSDWPADEAVTSTGDDLVWRAGPRALEHIRHHGLGPDDVRTVVLPATGPRWIALAALDRALLAAGWIAPRPGGARRVLVGASAGAWRALTLACRDAEVAHRELLGGYVDQVFARDVRPPEVSAAYRRMLCDVLTEERIRALVDRSDLGTVVLTDRTRWPVGSIRRPLQWAGLALCAAGNWVSPRLATTLLSPVAVASRPDDVPDTFEGEIAGLRVDNATEVALASGTLPLVMTPVGNPAGLPRGRYVDGGLLDYHLRRRWAPTGAGVTLLLHVGGPVRPGWFDRWRPSRRPAADVVGDLVVLQPSDGFLSRLPDGRLPDREDFLRFADDPKARLGRWRDAVSLGERLAGAFAQASSSDAIARRVRPLSGHGVA